MEFRGFSLMPQTTSLLNNPFLRPKMSGANMIGYPLTGHLDKPVKTKTWDFPKMSVALPIMPSKFVTMGKITCVVGGFVGSKSQRNQNTGAKFPLDALIRQEMEAILGLRDSSQRNGQEQESMPAGCSVVEELMASVCLANFETLEKQRCCRLNSECSVESNESDFIVFDDGDCNEETADEEFEEEDDEDEDEDEEEEEETVIFENVKKVRFNPVVKIHEMRVWDYASRAARISSWMQAGRDRVRFAERISQTEKILAPILSPDHRKKMLSRMTR